MGDQEFTVRIPPRDKKKNYHIMKFNANLKVDAGKWSQVRISGATGFMCLSPTKRFFCFLLTTYEYNGFIK